MELHRDKARGPRAELPIARGRLLEHASKLDCLISREGVIMAVKVIEGNVVNEGIKVGIVASRFNEFIVNKLLSGAL